MKKILIPALLFMSVVAKAQVSDRVFKPFKVDVSLGYAHPGGEGTKAGVLFVIEPKYAIIDQLAVGLRMEAAVTGRASMDQSTGEFKSADVGASASYLATADYYFTNNRFRPFVGGGAGFHKLASITVDENTTDVEDVPVSTKFGGMVRGGFEFGHFRTGIEYNFIGKTGTVKNGYLGIKLGFVIGGGRYE